MNNFKSILAIVASFSIAAALTMTASACIGVRPGPDLAHKTQFSGVVFEGDDAVRFGRIIRFDAANCKADIDWQVRTPLDAGLIELVEDFDVSPAQMPVPCSIVGIGHGNENVLYFPEKSPNTWRIGVFTSVDQSGSNNFTISDDNGGTVTKNAPSCFSSPPPKLPIWIPNPTEVMDQSVVNCFAALP